MLQQLWQLRLSTVVWDMMPKFLATEALTGCAVGSSFTICCIADHADASTFGLQLLEQGADVHYVSPKRQYGGSALHEAVQNNHEAVADLLLQHRADPFVENCSGYTAMDLAVAANHITLTRKLERCALFAGLVNMKVGAAYKQSHSYCTKCW